jgi:hypothetical protein
LLKIARDAWKNGRCSHPERAVKPVGTTNTPERTIVFTPLSKIHELNPLWTVRVIELPTNAKVKRQYHTRWNYRVATQQNEGHRPANWPVTRAPLEVTNWFGDPEMGVEELKEIVRVPPAGMEAAFDKNDTEAVLQVEMDATQEGNVNAVTW